MRVAWGKEIIPRAERGAGSSHAILQNPSSQCRRKDVLQRCSPETLDIPTEEQLWGRLCAEDGVEWLLGMSGACKHRLAPGTNGQEREKNPVCDFGETLHKFRLLVQWRRFGLLMWPIPDYEVTFSHAHRLEWLVSAQVRKWFGLRCLNVWEQGFLSANLQPGGRVPTYQSQPGNDPHRIPGSRRCPNRRV